MENNLTHKTEFKIRQMLGKDYHLSTSMVYCDEENTYKVDTWKLFRKYDDFRLYMSDKNEPIMTSEDSTIDDLYKFAKEHKRYNTFLELNRAFLIISIICMVLLIINIIVWHNETLRSIIFGIDITMIFSSIYGSYFQEKNFKADMKESMELFRKNMKDLGEETHNED